jgi:cysteinyl-tRNA synthetase
MSSPPELRLYNTLTRKKARFEPIDPRNVRVYACGPTVYDHLHIGNGRMLVVFDVLFRVLRHLYGADHVTYVRNITDVDDKINERATERGIDIRALTDEMIAVFQADAKALGCLEPTLEPRATDHIAPMLEIVGKLIERGHAYAAEGHVLFDVPSDADYGKLSRRPLDEMIAGARVEVAPYKRSPTDFVLWKPSAPGEPAWDSPWGRGRPGWHLECSAMSWKHLGEIFDIHGGGIDLVFPHHENEIAQTCSAFGHDVMANYWMHNGHLQVEGEKMSKSLGNFVTIHEALHEWPGEVLRFNLLKSHYTQPMDWRRVGLEESWTELRSWASFLHEHKSEMQHLISLAPNSAEALLLESLRDDLNTPATITVLRAMFSEAKRDLRALPAFWHAGRMLGLLDPTKLGALLPGAAATVTQVARYRTIIQELKLAYVNRLEELKLNRIAFLRKYGIRVSFREDGFPIFSSESSHTVEEEKAEEASFETTRRHVAHIVIPDPTIDSQHTSEDVDVEALIRQREAARAAKNWQESDRIRDELAAMGIALKDNKDGTTTWEVKR